MRFQSPSNQEQSPFVSEWIAQTPSTNAALKQRLQHEELPDKFLLATPHQTAGRGRGNRTWIAPRDKVLCFSFFHATQAPPMQVPAITMATALGVSDFLLHRTQIHASPKWPNDLLVNHHKICGILSEHLPGMGVIVGVGLNLSLTPTELQQIDRPATSILAETGQQLALTEALQTLCPFLAPRIDAWDRGGFSALQEEWTQRAGPIGKPLRIHDGANIKQGTLAGFGEYGELQLKINDHIETIWSGEIECPTPDE